MALSETGASPEEGFRALFDSNPQPMWIYDPTTLAFLDVNAAAVQHYGYSREEFLGMTIRDIRPPEDVEPLEAVASERVSQDFHGAGVWRHQRKSGEIRHVEIAKLGMRMDGRSVIVVTVHDITERWQAEQRLLKSQAQLAEAQRLAHLGNWEWHQTTRQVTWSDETYRLVGRPPDQPIGTFEQFLRYLHAEDRERLIETRKAALRTGHPWVLDYRIIREDGQIRHFHERGHVVTDPEDASRVLFGTVQDVTEIRQTEEALRTSEDLFRSLFEQAAVGISLTALDGRFERVNQRFAELVGYTQEELYCLTFQAITVPEDLPEALQQADRLLAGLYDTFTLEKRYVRKDGRRIWVNLTASLKRNENGTPEYFITVIEDITARKQAETELHRQRRLLATVVDALPINIYMKDPAGHYLMFNEAAARTTGISRGAAMGKTDFDLFPRALADRIRAKDDHTRRTGEETIGEEVIVSGGQERVMLAGRKMLHIGDSAPALLGFAIDITERKAAERRAEHLATHDPLTQLPNRTLLRDRLAHAIAHAARVNRMVAILFMDLDRFKLINDSFGHVAGDQLLVTMAERLLGGVRDGDTVARQGGDEFVVVLEDLAQAEAATHVAEEILKIIAMPVPVARHDLVISSSIGISLFPKDGQDAETLIKAADTAMYQAKELGGNAFRFFDREMNTQVFERLLKENGLRRALENGEFELHYQPIIDLASGRIAAVEALVRWAHPEKGLVLPVEFIPLAEETGQIVQIGEYVLREACRQSQQWQAMGLPKVRVSVNLAARQLSSASLLDAIRTALAETRLEPGLLELEVTETGLMQDVSRAVSTLHALAKMGLTVAIDDFGTGYSSLSYLKTLPIHALKVDRSFVRDVVTDGGDAAIVAATIALAHNMGLRVIAEGVQTPEQLDYLRRQRCDEVQGYYFSPPMTAEIMAQRLRQDLEAARGN